MASIDEEYQRDVKLRRQDVNSLMVWIKTQPHLPQISEYEVLWFLKSCYYNNEFSKTTLDTFYSFRSQERDMFHARSDEFLIRYSKIGLISPLTKQTPKGHSVLLMSLIDPNPENFDVINLFNLADSVIILNLHLNGTVDGLQVVLDMSNFSLSHLPKISLMVIKKSLIYIQQAVPLRLKGIHFININNKTFLDMLLSLAKPFMNKKLTDMIHLHGSINDLDKFVPIECLPKDYGGQEDSLQCLQEKMEKNLLDNRKFIEYITSEQLVDENKRPEDSKLSPEIFGVSGTFKKLELD